VDLSAFGPYASVFVGLTLGAIGLPIPEELVLLAAGASAHRGLGELVPMLVVAAVAVIATDGLVFAIGHHFGPAALARRPARWLLPPERRERVEKLLADHGSKMVFAARFVPGLRAPTFLLLGAHHMRVSRFFEIDAAAVAISVPALVGLGYVASSSVDRIAADIARGKHVIAVAVAVAVVVAAIVSVVRAHHRRRRG
jgi:membrane protein DedA with SNARE-associated domain